MWSKRQTIVNRTMLCNEAQCSESTRQRLKVERDDLFETLPDIESVCRIGLLGLQVLLDRYTNQLSVRMSVCESNGFNFL